MKMLKPYQFPYSKRKGPDVTTELSEGVAMTDKEIAAVDHEAPPAQPVLFHVHGLDALVVEMGIMNERMKMLIDDLYKARVFVDNWFPISANVAYTVDYLDHKLLFLYSLTGVTLLVEGVTIVVQANAWTSIGLHRGAKIYAQGVSDASPATVLVRACDELQDTSVGLLNELVDIEAQTGTSDYPVGAIPITGSSGNQANAAAVATLAALPGVRTWITGFEVTGGGATVGLNVTVTVTGVVGGPLSYTFTFIVGALIADTPLIVEFPKPIPSTAVNTAIVVTVPAGGLGNTNTTVVAHGYQLL